MTKTITSLIDAQEKLLTILLGTADYSGKIFNRVKAEYFTDKRFKNIFLLIKSIFLGGEGYKLPLGEEKEYYNLVDSLKNDYISGANWEFYANFLAQEYEKRVLAQAKLKAENIETLDDLTQIYEETRSKLSKEDFNAVEINDELLTSMKEDYHKGFNAVQSGYVALDKIINGFYQGEYITLAGATGMGKTATGLNLLLNFAKQGRKTMFISLEMSRISLLNRLICAESGLVSDRIRGRMLKEKALELYDKTFNEALKPLPFVILDMQRMTIEDIRLQATTRQKEKGLDILIIDYLGLIEHKNKALSSYQKMCELTRELKILAKELNIPVICLAQVNRSVKDRQNKRPLLSDLKDSGSIENDSDIVMFCYRDEYYNPKATKKPDIIEIIVAKHRNGELGTAELIFDKATQKISEEK